MLSWVPVVLLALVCVGFAACGSDGDSDGGSNPGAPGSANVLSVEGQSATLTNAYWASGNVLIYSFSVEEFQRTQQFPEVLSFISIQAPEWASASELPVGEFKNFRVDLGINVSPKQGSHGPMIEANYDGKSQGTANLKITKSGDVYTIVISNLTLTTEEGGQEKDVPNFSFAFTGPVQTFNGEVK